MPTVARIRTPFTPRSMCQRLTWLAAILSVLILRLSITPSPLLSGTRGAGRRAVAGRAASQDEAGRRAVHRTGREVDTLPGQPRQAAADHLRRRRPGMYSTFQSNTRLTQTFELKFPPEERLPRRFRFARLHSREPLLNTFCVKCSSHLAKRLH